MSVELTIETVEETIVLELQDHVPAVLTIDNIPELRDELDSKVDKEVGMGLSELSFTTDDKLSLDQSEQDRHTHSNKPVIDGLSDDAGVLQYKGLPISDQAALDAKVDKVAGYSLVDDAEIAKLATVQENATANRSDSLNADKVHDHTVSQVFGLSDRLDSIDSLIGDVEAVLIAINGEPTP